LYAYDFRIYFTPLPGSFRLSLTVLVHYRRSRVLALEDGPPSSDRISRVPPYFSRAWFHTQPSGTGLSPAAAGLSRPFPEPRATSRRLLPFSLATTLGISVISVPPATEMFQFTGFALPALCIQTGVTLAGRVSPFGHLRINALCQLPAAFRRLPRPSSPVIAKASIICT